MKRCGILNSHLSRIVARLGHTDMICISDAGLPIPDGVERVDLAVGQDVPSVLQILESVLLEACVEQAIVATELQESAPELLDALKERLDGIELMFVPHEDFKTRTQSTKAIVRTGQMTPFANIILVSGVTF